MATYLRIFHVHDFIHVAHELLRGRATTDLVPAFWIELFCIRLRALSLVHFTSVDTAKWGIRWAEATPNGYRFTLHHAAEDTTIVLEVDEASDDLRIVSESDPAHTVGRVVEEAMKMADDPEVLQDILGSLDEKDLLQLDSSGK